MTVPPRLGAIALVLVTSLACGGGSDSPTSPSRSSTPSAPSVAGNYAGSVTIVYPEVPLTLICPATTSVNQTGFSVSIAPLVVTGQCGRLSAPIGSTTIDANGSLGNESGSFSEPSCGTYSYGASGGFFGRELRVSMIASSRTCLNFNLTAVLSR